MQSYQALVEEHGSKAAAARALGIPVTTFKSRLYAKGCRILTAMRADRGLSQPKKRKAA